MPRFGRRWLRSVAVAGLLAAASRTSAQVVRSQTLLEPGREPAAAVVVELLDSAGTARVDWAFSDDQGRFSLRAAGHGPFIVRAMRIGLRPLRLPLVLGGADTSLVLRLRPIPLPLPPVVARNERSCNTRPDSGLALGSLWSDAESALLAASVTRSSPDYRFAFVDYTRDFDFETRASTSRQRGSSRIPRCAGPSGSIARRTSCDRSTSSTCTSGYPARTPRREGRCASPRSEPGGVDRHRLVRARAGATHGYRSKGCRQP